MAEIASKLSRVRTALGDVSTAAVLNRTNIANSSNDKSNNNLVPFLKSDGLTRNDNLNSGNVGNIAIKKQPIIINLLDEPDQDLPAEETEKERAGSAIRNSLKKDSKQRRDEDADMSSSNSRKRIDLKAISRWYEFTYNEKYSLVQLCSFLSQDERRLYSLSIKDIPAHEITYIMATLPEADISSVVCTEKTIGKKSSSSAGGGGHSRSNSNSNSNNHSSSHSNSNSNSISNIHSKRSIVSYDHVPNYIYPHPPVTVGASPPSSMKNPDPAQCLEYIHDMYNVHYSNELEYASAPYMHLQHDLNPKMRSIVIDWMVETHSFKFNHLKLGSASLWLSVNIFDRYLRQSQMNRSKLQLVGITCVLLATKYEESEVPCVEDCVVQGGGAFNKAQLLEMETSVLTRLDYDISVPTTYHFLVRYLNVIKASELVKNLAHFYAERNLQEYDLLSFSPHIIAAAAVFAALRQNPATSRGDCWSRSLRSETGCEVNDLLLCAKQMIRHCSEESETASKRKLNCASKKFQADKFLAVASLPLPKFDEF